MGKPLKARQAAARLGVAVEALPHGGLWSREEVRVLRLQRPGWLSQARREYAARQDAKAVGQRIERERQLAAAPKHDCLCCETEFPFTTDSGGLCAECDEGWCPRCGGNSDQDWLYG